VLLVKFIELVKLTACAVGAEAEYELNLIAFAARDRVAVILSSSSVILSSSFNAAVSSVELLVGRSTSPDKALTACAAATGGAEAKYELNLIACAVAQ